jgi:glycosyltransferase involved in cell wall biosynthesis
MTATIIICTHNRAALLARAVAGARAEAEAYGASVLVVDNASTDDTPAVLTALASRAGPHLRIIHEPHLGLSAARNRGLAETRGEVAVYLDDDAVPRPGWLAALLAPYTAAGVACVGGRVRLHFATPPPPWLTPPLHPALSAFDLGDAPRRLRDRPGDEYPYGANISFRSAVARAHGGFSTHVGPRGRHELVHDETDLCFRVDRAGGEIHYAPAAVVDHWVLPERLTPQWFLTRHALRGRSAAVFELRNRGLRPALGRVRWFYGPHLAVRPYAPGTAVDPVRLIAECRRREALGYLAGLARGMLRLRALRRDLPADPPQPAALAAPAGGRP